MLYTVYRPSYIDLQHICLKIKPNTRKYWHFLTSAETSTWSWNEVYVIKSIQNKIIFLHQVKKSMVFFKLQEKFTFHNYQQNYRNKKSNMTWFFPY